MWVSARIGLRYVIVLGNMARTTKTSKGSSGKSAIARSKKPVNPYSGLNRTLHVVSLAVLTALIGAIIFVAKPTYYPLSLSYVTKDALLSEQATVYVPAERVVVDVDVRWALLALLAFGAIYSLLLLTRWSVSYQKAQTGRIYLWRWVYFALAGALLTKLAAVVSGVEDILAIKVAAALMVFAAGFAWLSERQNEKSTKPVWSAFVLASAAAITALTPIIGSLFGTTMYGMVQVPWYTYALSGIAVTAPVLIGANLFYSHRRGGQIKYGLVERNYIVALLVLQVITATVFLVAFR